jgi:SET domain-containing protein
MSTVDVVDFLNSIVKTRIAPSPIHGVGLFAIRDIPKGMKFFADHMPRPYRLSAANQSKLFPEVRALLMERWPRMVDGEAFGYPDTYIQGYMNHADDPNYDLTLDVALRDIKAGEEITEDYRLIPGWERAFPWLVRDTL